MRSEKRGIVVNKAEIAALLEFASRDVERSLSNVQIRVEGSKLFAYATDGRRAIEAIGGVADGEDGEWALGREYLAELRKLLGNDDRAVLLVSGASLHEALIEDEDGNQRSSLTWPKDAASTQTTIPVLRQAMAIPRGAKRASCVSVPASQLGAIALVGRAAGWDEVDIYVPKGRADPLVFRVDASPTTWTGCIMPTGKDDPEGTEA